MPGWATDVTKGGGKTKGFSLGRLQNTSTFIFQFCNVTEDWGERLKSGFPAEQAIPAVTASEVLIRGAKSCEQITPRVLLILRYSLLWGLSICPSYFSFFKWLRQHFVTWIGCITGFSTFALNSRYALHALRGSRNVGFPRQAGKVVRLPWDPWIWHPGVSLTQCGARTLPARMFIDPFDFFILCSFSFGRIVATEAWMPAGHIIVFPLSDSWQAQPICYDTRGKHTTLSILDFLSDLKNHIFSGQIHISSWEG